MLPRSCFCLPCIKTTGCDSSVHICIGTHGAAASMEYACMCVSGPFRPPSCGRRSARSRVPTYQFNRSGFAATPACSKHKKRHELCGTPRSFAPLPDDRREKSEHEFCKKLFSSHVLGVYFSSSTLSAPLPFRSSTIPEGLLMA